MINGLDLHGVDGINYNRSNEPRSSQSVTQFVLQDSTRKDGAFVEKCRPSRHYKSTPPVAKDREKWREVVNAGLRRDENEKENKRENWDYLSPVTGGVKGADLSSARSSCATLTTYTTRSIF